MVTRPVSGVAIDDLGEGESAEFLVDGVGGSTDALEIYIQGVKIPRVSS